jgi:hypothetical protein
MGAGYNSLLSFFQLSFPVREYKSKIIIELVGHVVVESYEDLGLNPDFPMYCKYILVSENISFGRKEAAYKFWLFGVHEINF